MSEHRASVSWRHAGGPFDYDSYSRDHSWTFPGGFAAPASAAPEFLGDAARVDPEEALVAAAASCHMLTFLAIAARRRLSVESYVDDAVGYLDKNEDGRLAVVRIDLRPRVRFAGGQQPSAAELQKLHESAHRGCFIANSLRSEIRVVAEDTGN